MGFGVQVSELVVLELGIWGGFCADFSDLRFRGLVYGLASGHCFCFFGGGGGGGWGWGLLGWGFLGVSGVPLALGALKGFGVPWGRHEP